MSPWEFFNSVLFNIGDTQVRLSSIVTVVVALIALFVVARLVENWLHNRVLKHTRLDAGARATTASLVRYCILVVGVTLIMQNIGINLAALGVLAGALGVGIGFGLQNVFSNFISGLIVMLERPVKIGDRIEIGGVEGDVINIGLRATTLATARRAQLIIPNQKLITEVVRNWDAGGDRSSLMITLKTKPESDPRQVQTLLGEAAREVNGVAQVPEPTVDLAGVDGGGYSFQVQVWMSGDGEQRSRVLSALYFETYERLRKAGVTVV